MTTLRELVAELRERLAQVPTASTVIAKRDQFAQLLDAADENERLRALLGEALFFLGWPEGFRVQEVRARIEAELRPQTGEAKP